MLTSTVPPAPLSYMLAVYMLLNTRYPEVSRLQVLYGQTCEKTDLAINRAFFKGLAPRIAAARCADAIVQ